MSNYGNEEQKARYLDALEVEKNGYEAKVKQAKIEGDSNAEAFWNNSIAEVDAEIAAVNGDDSAAEVSIEDKIANAKAADIDAIAGELGFEFPDDVSKLADKKSALLEHVQA